MTVVSEPCTVLELRQYTLYPGRREELVDLFDPYLVEPQEESGLHVIGQFTDSGRPDRFVWFRGYRDMDARLKGLSDFYLHSDAWAAHRDAANATMIDSDNVLLLRTVVGCEHLCDAVQLRPALGESPATATDMYAVSIHYLLVEYAADAVAFWLDAIRPSMQAAGVRLVAVLHSAHIENNFPRLPVRADVEALVVVSRHASGDDLRTATRRLESDESFAESGRKLAELEQHPRELLVLEPTARSSLR